MSKKVCLELKLPVKLIESEVYAVILEDADGVRHFFTKDGKYDGFDAPMEIVRDVSKEKGKDIVDTVLEMDRENRCGIK